MKRFRSIAEVTIGVLYAIGAVHQLAFVLQDSDAFYEAMAAASWLSPAATFIEQVLLPRSTVVTLSVGLLEAGLAIAILSRGRAVRPALYVGGAFSVLGALTGAPLETVGYGALAVLHFWLASQRGEPSSPDSGDAGADSP
ncbi:MAG: hypothetical protein ACR2N7_02575 [Acidimicrobiia bacterium]